MALVTMAMVILAALASPVAGLDNKTLDDYRTLILVKDRSQWDEGRNICISQYTDLVTLYDKKDELELLKLASTSYLGVFIGLKKGNSSIWSNGDPVIYRKNALYDHNMCVAMKADGGWEALQCTENRTFICYSEVPGNSSRYTLIEEEKSWYEAQKFCRENYTDLVSIKDEEQNNAVYAEKQKDNVWIGLIRDGWEWADGGLSGYRNWSSNANFIGDHTVVRISDSTDDNGWMPASETTDIALICYKDHIHISDKSMPWEESLKYCERFNGSFSIVSPKEQLAATRLMRRLKITKPVWVGLQQSSSSGSWVWTTRETLAWKNWKGGQVPQLPLSHHCGALMPEKDDFKWTDMDCMIKQRALCYDWVVTSAKEVMF